MECKVNLAPHYYKTKIALEISLGHGSDPTTPTVKIKNISVMIEAVQNFR